MCCEQQKHPSYFRVDTEAANGPEELKPSAAQCGLQCTLDIINPLLMELNPKEM